MSWFLVEARQIAQGASLLEQWGTENTGLIDGSGQGAAATLTHVARVARDCDNTSVTFPWSKLVADPRLQDRFYSKRTSSVEKQCGNSGNRYAWHDKTCV